MPLPVADEGIMWFPQRSKNRRISVSPHGFSGTARWIFCSQSGEQAIPATRPAGERSETDEVSFPISHASFSKREVARRAGGINSNRAKHTIWSLRRIESDPSVSFADSSLSQRAPKG